jgi:hypothetical protein
MKIKNFAAKLYFIAITILLTGLSMPVFSYDYFVENIQSIIKRSTDIVEAEVIDITQSTDEHNVPVRIVTLKVNEVIAGKSVEPVIIVEFLLLGYENDNRPLAPNFKIGENAIVHLMKRADNTYTFVGHGNQGKFNVTGTTIESTSISASHFKKQIKDVRAGRADRIDIPVLSDGDYAGEGISKLGGEFHLLTVAEGYGYGPTSGTIQFRINPANAKDKDGNPLSFNDIKAAIDRAVSSWNNGPHSYATFSVYSSSVSSSRVSGDGISTITFEDGNETYHTNAATIVTPQNGIINEVDIFLTKIFVGIQILLIQLVMRFIIPPGVI